MFFFYYIVVDLGEENVLFIFLFFYVCCDNNNKDNFKEMDILGSNIFDGKNYDESQIILLVFLSNLFNIKVVFYELDIIKVGVFYCYFWFKVKFFISGFNWIVLVEFGFLKVIVKIYDLEIGEIIIE